MTRTVLAAMLSVAGALAIVVTTPASLMAQSAQGGLRGTVKDAQGVIPGAAVTLINEGTSVARETVTNDSGEYSFPAVEPAVYTVRTSVPGFKTFERRGVRISTQQFVGLDIVLELGTLEETITVTADAPLIETTNASVGGVLDTKTLEAIPTAGRSVFLMATLEPTVQTSGNARWNRMQDQTGNSAMSMGGGPVRSNNYLVDGFPVTDLQNRASTNPSIEAVQEMKVQVHTYDAEMGRTGGGVINMAARSGTNTFAGSGYAIFRPQKMQEQLLIPKLRNQEFVPEYWRNGGGGVGGPILRNRTFFWFAGEAYVNDQPQQNSFLVPTSAMRNGDFSGVTRNGVLQVVRDPLTGQPFPGNIIPVSRMDPVGRALVGYFPTPDQELDNGSPNFSMTDLLPNKAHQFTTKVNHNFTNNAAISGFVLRQVTSEANANYNPQHRFVGPSYQLERTINTLVLNNTYVLNNSTVLTLRGGINQFNDDYVLPHAFDAVGLWNNPGYTSLLSDTNRFPSLTINGYRGAGYTNRQDNGYYQYGFNGSLSKLAGSHNYKFGGDFRVLGQKSINFGASTGTFTFTGLYSGNSVADLLLGYPQSGNVPLNTELDGFVRYYAAYAQDDWRINDRFTLNYGVRLERETGMMERNNNMTVDFDKNAVSPLNSMVNLIDPVTGQRRDIMGGLVYAGVNGAPTVQGNQPAVKIAPRVGAVYRFDEKTVLRGGWGMYWAPWNYAAAGLNGWGQIGYSATTFLQQPQGTGAVPTLSLSDPFPNGLVQPTANSLGLLTGTGGDIYFVDPDKGAPRVQQYSFDLQRELPGAMSISLGYTGLTGSQLSWGGSSNATININQLDPAYQSLSSTTTLVPNPFFGIPEAGAFGTRQTIENGRLLRPYPQFDNVYMLQSTGARSQYHAAIVQIRKRPVGWFGGNFSYTWSRLNDNQFGESNFYSSAPGLQNVYTVIPGSPYYNPDLEYGRSLLDTPHKIVIAPTVLLPFGEGRKFLSDSTWGHRILGDWQVTPVISLNSGFPIGVSQNLLGTAFLWGGTPRPNVVPGVDPLMPGDITDRIRANPNDNLYLNPAAFETAPANQFGNAPRTLPGVYSPWRNNVDLSIQKQVRTGGRTSAQLKIEVINMFNIVQWAAPASSAFGNASFAQVTNQATNMRVVQFMARFQF